MTMGMTKAFYPVRAIAVDEAAFDENFRQAMEGRFDDAIMRDTRRGSDYPLDFLLLQRDSDQAVVAAAKLVTFEGSVSLRYLTTAHDSTHRFYGRRLFAELFNHVTGLRPLLVLTGYTHLGRDYLAPLEKRLRRRHSPALEVIYDPWS